MEFQILKYFTALSAVDFSSRTSKVKNTLIKYFVIKEGEKGYSK